MVNKQKRKQRKRAIKKLASEIQLRDNVFKSELRRKATFAEKRVRKIFNSVKLRHKFQKSFWKLTGKLKGYHCIVDFYIFSLHLAIEIDGGYHKLPQQKRKDDFKDNWLKKARKVKMLRVKNEEVENIMEMINKLIYKPGNKKYCNYKYWKQKYKKYSKSY